MRRFYRNLTPDIDALRQHTLFRWMGQTLLHPALWQVNRRSSARAVAIGLFCGLFPGPLQMLSAALMSMPTRAYLPLALLTTFYSNPLTIVPLYGLGFALGTWTLGTQAAFVMPPERTGTWGEWLSALGAWMAGLGEPLALGVAMLAALLAVLGFIAVDAAWRVHTALALRRRRGRPRPA